jgi:predicted nucleotidyltransferase
LTRHVRKTEDDPVLTRFRTALLNIYRNRVQRMVLYGSRARGEARPDSDYDIAVFIKDLATPADELGRLADVETDILYETGAVINAMPYPAGTYEDRTSLMREIRREGIDL